MNIVIEKFGGTSVGTLERIKNVAKIIKSSIETANDVVVVVSAMAGITNKLIAFSNNLNNYEGNREYDVIASAGEQVSAGLVATALNNLGINAKSYLAWQLPIITDNLYGQANILNIKTEKIQEDLQKHITPVICGFQGISKKDGSITTIGRGGSDLTAVAVASALKADMCKIYSDVDGIYTTDPNKISTAKLIDYINYKEMLELSLNGAKVLQARSVDYAMKNNVKIHAVSSFVNTAGTIVSGSKSLNKQIVGIGISENLISFKISPEKYALLLSEMEKNFIRIILKENYKSDYIITINQQDLRVISQILQKINGKQFHCNFYNSPYINISLVGLNIGQDSEILNIVYKVLFGLTINSIICLENSINITLNKQYEFEALRILHNTFI